MKLLFFGKIRFLWLYSCVLIASSLCAARFEAGTNGFVVPEFRGSSGSSVGFWEVFKVPVGEPGNLPDQSGSTTAATLFQLNTNAFVTGSGNIYNLETSSFILHDSHSVSPATVVLQIRTVGSELDYSSVALNFTNASGPQHLTPLFRYELSRAIGQGPSVSSLWQWDLTSLGLTAYDISFVAGGPSVSFDSMTLDTAPVFTNTFAEQPFILHSIPPEIAYWNYSFNGNPTGRPTASVFGSLGSSPDFDSRDAQFLLSWTTTYKVPAGRGATNYLIKRARITLTIASGNQYAYSGTLRDYRSYFPTNDPAYVANSNHEDTVDLFGVGYRGSFNLTNWGVNPDGDFHSNRVAYAAGFNTSGALVDVSNNVGDDSTNEISNPFEIAPFAVGQTTNVAPGELMPAGSQLTFDINLQDPLIYGYLQRSLNEGKLDFMATSLIAASLFGPPTYPNFYTIYSPVATSKQIPLLDIEGEVIRPSVDGDGDGLPDDWENFYFATLVENAARDRDADGVSNWAEYQSGTSPNDASHHTTLAIQRNGSGTEIRFPFAAGKEYVLQSSETLSANSSNWRTVTNAPVTYSSAWLAKTGTNLVYPSPVYAVSRDTNAPASARFYRLQGK